jgi:SNF2 family DNA or RNA helicase
MQKHPEKFRRLPKTSPYLEITLDPLENYALTWKCTGVLSPEQKQVIKTLFPDEKTHVVLNEYINKVSFIRSLENMAEVVVRPEVYEKLGQYFDNLLLQNNGKKNKVLDFSEIKEDLFPYQKEGVAFCLFKRAAIIADEMGLGKTLQAIAVAVMKRKYLDFRKTLIICPTSVKYQWQKEILRFAGEEAIVVEGFPAERKLKYNDNNYYFFIVNYETVTRDFEEINHSKFDLIILDEAQKIKNFETKTS